MVLHSAVITWKSTDILMVICEYIIMLKSALGSVCLTGNQLSTPVELVPSHSASPFCDSSFSQSIRPLWSGSFSFHLHFQDFVLIPFLIWTPPTPLLKLCLTGQNRSAFSFKLLLSVPSCSDFKLHWNPILCHFFISLDHYHLLGAECRIIVSQWCPHPQNLRGC